MTDIFGTVQRTLFFALLIGSTLFFLWVLHAFAMPIFWSVVFAVTLFPVFHWIRDQVRSGSLASLITILLLLVVVFAPLYTIGSMVANEAVGFYQRLSESGTSYVATIEQIPLIADTLELAGLETSDVRERIASGLQSASSWIASQTISIGLATFDAALKFVLMLYLLFFFLRDGERIAGYFMRLLPLGDERERLLFGWFVSTTRAIMKGSVLVALVQGLVGGILFAVVGIPNPALWGAVMAFTALIPAIGPSIIWLPAGVILLATGNVWQGVAVLATGGVVISLIDNLLRPLLVGHDVQMPDALILIAMLGGLAAFGISGLIIGPVAAALVIAFWDIFAREFGEDLATRG